MKAGLSLRAFAVSGGVAAVFLAASIFARAQTQNQPQQTLPADSGIDLRTPSRSNVQGRWVIPPTSNASFAKLKPEELRFGVDANGRPWFGLGHNLIACPVNKERFKLSIDFHDFVFFDNGALWVSTDQDFGFIAAVDKLGKTGTLAATYQPVSHLPLEQSHLVGGGRDTLYMYGINEARKAYEVYMLSSGKPNAMERRRMFSKLFSSSEKITAVAGDEQRTFIALGRNIVEIVRGRKETRLVLEHPDETIHDLAFTPDAGLYFATESSVGYAGDNGRFEFLKIRRPSIILRKGALYVLSGDSGGVIKITGIAEFSNLRPVKGNGSH